MNFRIESWITAEELKKEYHYLIGKIPSSLFGQHILIATEKRAILIEKFPLMMREKSDKEWDQLLEVRFIQGGWLHENELSLRFYRYPYRGEFQENLKVPRWTIQFPSHVNVDVLAGFLRRKEQEGRNNRAKMVYRTAEY